MSNWTTADLLTSVKSLANLPDATSGSLSPTVLLSFATKELHINLVPMILACREKYYETFSDTLIQSGVAIIPISTRAIGGVLSACQFILGSNIVNLPPIDPSEVTTTSVNGTPRGYYYENNNIHLVPTPGGAGGSIRQRYFQRPSRLELVTNCAQISAIDTVAFTVTSAAVPSTWSTGSVVDFIPSYIPYTPYGLGSVITGISSGVVSFAALPAGVLVGDWLALSDFTPIPEVPFEFQPVLEQATVCKALESGSDGRGLADAKASLAEYRKAAVSLITPRNQSSPKKIVSGWGRY